MTGLEILLDAMPAGSHIRIVKCRRYPDHNPWVAIAFAHVQGKPGRRGQPRIVFREMGRGTGATVDAAAGRLVSYLDARALLAISEPAPEPPADDLPWDADGYDL